MSKNLIWVFSAVDGKNLKLTESAINEQFDKLKNGQFSEQELSQAKFSIKTSLQETNDNLNLLETFFLNRILNNDFFSVNDFLEKINCVSHENVQQAAKLFKHILTFTLKEQSSTTT